MLRFFGQLLLCVLMLGSLFTIFSQPAVAADNENTWEFIAGYDYFHIRDGLPESFKDNLEPESKVVDLVVSFSTGTDNGQLNFRLESKGNSINFKTNLSELAWSQNVHQILYEIGKTKWVWGRGLSFIPTCPLDKDTYYWGLQSSLIYPGNSFTIGTAVNEDSYNSNNIRNGITLGQDFAKGYTGWLRQGWIFDTSDITMVISYQSVQDLWNFGFDFSRDLLNGFEFHGGVNLRSPDSSVRYLIGGEYSGKYFYIVEFYHETDDQLILAMSNSTEMFGSWQWEIREVYDLNDKGEIRKFSIKYIKNSNIVPGLEVSMNAGPNSSKYQQNPFDYSASFKVTTKF